MALGMATLRTNAAPCPWRLPPAVPTVHQCLSAHEARPMCMVSAARRPVGRILVCAATGHVLTPFAANDHVAKRHVRGRRAGPVRHKRGKIVGLTAWPHMGWFSQLRYTVVSCHFLSFPVISCHFLSFLVIFTTGFRFLPLGMATPRTSAAPCQWRLPPCCANGSSVSVGT